MDLLVKIHVEDEEIPAELKDWRIEEWGTPGIGLLLSDGDGGAHWVESVLVLDEELH